LEYLGKPKYSENAETLEMDYFRDLELLLNKYPDPEDESDSVSVVNKRRILLKEGRFAEYETLTRRKNKELESVAEIKSFRDKACDYLSLNEETYYSTFLKCVSTWEGYLLITRTLTHMKKDSDLKITRHETRSIYHKYHDDFLTTLVLF
jgi:hypothetical protein